jgi:hypothetical protein
MNRRLDSWKAIAEYLGRDTATARRWEKTLGLPVHRVAGGAGRSVFAYTDDIDTWLASSREPVNQPAAAEQPAGADQPPVATVAAVSDPAVPVPDAAPPVVARNLRAQRVGAAAAVVVALLGTSRWATSSRTPNAPLQVTVNEHRVLASDERGVERWRFDFPANTQTMLPAYAPARVVGDKTQTIYVATSYRMQLPEGPIEGGELTVFDTAGRRQRVFSFDDQVTMRGTKFGAPWVLTDFAVADANDTIAASAHHYMWSPSVVTVLDRELSRRGTWTHDGWIETLKWVGPQRLVAGGFDQERNGGFAALLDTGTMKPVRMVVMPRTEINVVTASRFNRAVLQPVNGRILARTIEMPDELSQGAIDAIYEFTPSLESVHASFSTRYWEMHGSLEVQGKLRHSQAECPDRNGPREILVWEPSTGWRSQPTAR